MNKFWKIFISIILVLVVAVGVYVGIVTKGFRKWENLKNEKDNISNLYNNGKTGVSNKDYTQLQEEYNELQERCNSIESENKWLKGYYLGSANDDLFIVLKDTYTGVSIEKGNNSFLFYDYNKTDRLQTITPYKLKQLEQFDLDTSVFEFRSFEICNVEDLDCNVVTSFDYEDISKKITNDRIAAKTFKLFSSTELTNEQNELLSVGTDDTTKFKISVSIDCSLDEDYYNFDTGEYNYHLTFKITVLKKL